jgi:hypothetical protein
VTKVKVRVENPVGKEFLIKERFVSKIIQNCATKYHNIIGDSKFSVEIYNHFFLMHKTSIYDSTPFDCEGRTKP